MLKLLVWLKDKLAEIDTSEAKYHNETSRAWMKGYRKALKDVLDRVIMINSKEK